MGRRYLLLVTAMGEGVTGLALATTPKLVLELLLGVSKSSPEAIVIARVTGGALLALAVVCWFARNERGSASGRGVLVGVLLYDCVAAAMLVSAMVVDGLVGVALWPAVAAHVALAGWCVGSLVARLPPSVPIERAETESE